MLWDRLEARARSLSLLVALMSIIASIIVLLGVTRRLITIEGEIAYGFIGLTEYQLRVLGEQASIPPLDSISLIVKLDIALALAGLILGVLATIHTVKLYHSKSLALSSVSAVASAFTLTLTHSLYRVVADDVLPVLPTRGVYITTAGRLYLEESMITKSLALVLYERIGFIMILGAILLVIAGALLAYLSLRLHLREEQAGKP